MVTPAELRQQVREVFAFAAGYLAVLARGSQEGVAASFLARPDVTAILQSALDQGRELAQDAVREVWGGSPHAPYLDWLLTDIDLAYSSLALLRAEVRVTWHSTPGDRPGAVRHAVLAHGAAIALRNELSAEVARVAAHTQAQLASAEEAVQAGETAWKQWRCSFSPPDPSTCHWCRALHGMVIPLHASFPAGQPADLTGHGNLTQPPRLYHGVLHGPPRHPRCRCHIVILTSLPGEDEEVPPGEETSFADAVDIRALPEIRYQVLIHFLEAATHELSQLLGRLRHALDLGKPE